MPNALVVKIMYKELLKLHNAEFKTLVTHVHDLLRHVNPQAWENQSLGEGDIDRTKMYLYDEYVQQWRKNNDTVVNCKLITYCTFKDSFKIEPYLLHICDFKLTRVISRFRLRCHNLEIDKDIGMCNPNKDFTQSVLTAHILKLSIISRWIVHSTQKSELHTCT